MQHLKVVKVKFCRIVGFLNISEVKNIMLQQSTEYVSEQYYQYRYFCLEKEHGVPAVVLIHTKKSSGKLQSCSAEGCCVMLAK